MKNSLRTHLRVNTRYDAQGSLFRTDRQEIARTEEGEEDNYFSKILKYIPGEIVTAYLFAAGLIGEYVLPTEGPSAISSELSNAEKFRLHIIVAIFLLVITPIYRYLAIRIPRSQVKWDLSALVQAGIAMIAFAIWLYALGGPFDNPDIPGDWHKTYGGLALFGATLLLPLLERIFLPAPTPPEPNPYT